MFLTKALSADGSCRQAVNDAMVKRVIGGMKPGSTDTGGYCKARARLPMRMVSTLARAAGGILAKGAPLLEPVTWSKWGRANAGSAISPHPLRTPAEKPPFGPPP
jgi:hypothetical protein